MKSRLIEQLLRISAWISQGVNAIFLFGHHDQTVSARAYQHRYSPRWRVVYKVINAIFFWQDDHCYISFRRDVEWAKIVLQVMNEKPS